MVEIFKLCGKSSIPPAQKIIKRLQKNCRDFRSGAVVPLDFIRARYYTVAGLPQGGSDFLISGQNMHRFHAVKRADGKFFGTQPVWKISGGPRAGGRSRINHTKAGALRPPLPPSFFLRGAFKSVQTFPIRLDFFGAVWYTDKNGGKKLFRCHAEW